MWKQQHVTVCYSFGSNSSRLGVHPFSDEDYLQKPKLPQLHSIVRGIYNGFKHTVLVTKENEIVVFGSNFYGQ